jgi:membrane-bound toxin of toxin-antitoxin system
MDSVLRLRVELRASLDASSAVFVGCVATASLIASLPLPWWLRCLATVLVGMYALALSRRWARGSRPNSIVAIELGLDHRVLITQRGGRVIQGNVQADSYVGPLLTTIVLRPDGMGRSTAIAILPDMLPREDFRRLRVMLRFKQPPHGDVRSVTASTN